MGEPAGHAWERSRKGNTMHRYALIVVCVVFGVSVTIGPVSADAQASNAPTFTKGKFAVPVNRDAVTADWTARGYSHPRVKPYAQGWLRGEHTHPEYFLFTVTVGRMEFIIAGQHFVLEPGDELFYPAHAVHSARNLYEGTSQLMSSSKQ
jgi:mannose-6-phosphate isomerase-like protein (cupin superfamily)